MYTITLLAYKNDNIHMKIVIVLSQDIVFKYYP